ncbi:MAG TPA: DivIVA domain-containing protein [Candidatus Onthovivens sp.]|nr:DivIVA domain-containing protein [Candidatus Onthovivens sp.]
MKFKLKEEDILNKKFKANVKGYDCDEVDAFLDLVLSDYNLINELDNSLDDQLITLKRDNEGLKAQIRDLEQKLELISAGFKVDSNGVYSSLDNLELLQRCGRYEKKLYDLGVNPSKIK